MNPNLFFFGPLILVWGYVSIHFLRAWWRNKTWVSCMLSTMPLGWLLCSLREMHVLSRGMAELLYSFSLTIGLLTAWVLNHNSRARRP